MAKMTVDEILDNKYLTDSNLAQQLVAGTLSLNDQIIKDHIHQTGAYQVIYGSEGDVPSDEIWYTATSRITPDKDVFGATYIDEDSTFNETTGEGILKFDGDVTSIGSSAFSGCTSLTSIEIPDSVISIESWAFAGCTSLTSIEIPDSVISIESWAFAGCTSLPIIDNCRYADTYLIEVVDKTLSTYTIKDGTKFIGSSAFSGCTSLTSIEIPDSVISIGNSAFQNCTSLTSIEIPDSVISIGDSAFYSCRGLTSIDIPNSVTRIEASAFEYCSGLTSIDIPDSVTSIGSGAFGSISAKISFSKLYSTYTSRIFYILTLTEGSYTFNVEFNVSEIPTDYNISSMLLQATDSGKFTITYNIYTDYAPCKDQALALVTKKTIVNVYHIDGTPWE